MTRLLVLAAALLLADAVTASACGVERWPVKTLQDRPPLTGPVKTTIDHLVSLPVDQGGQNTRSAAESVIYTITGQLTFEKQEADGDIHAVLTAGSGAHMIVEFPATDCTVGAVSRYRVWMAQARSWLIQHAHVGDVLHVEGVLFFDFNHGQHGVAPNAVELHPVLVVWK